VGRDSVNLRGMQSKIAKALRALALGIWVGGIVMGFVVASTVFKQFEKDHTMAGLIVGGVLDSAGKVKLAVALAALVLEGFIFYKGASGTERGWRRYAPPALLMLAMLLLLASTLWLQPRLHELRQQVGHFGPENINDPDRISFGKLHGLSMGLLLLEGLFVALALLVGLL